jgi:hypothetical protein
MDINYWGIGLFIANGGFSHLADQTDEKTFEKDIIQSELKPAGDEDHDEKSPANL